MRPPEDVSSDFHRYYILRHGETDANASGRIQGSSDISRLTERGRAQAASAGASVFTNCPIDTVYVSPLTRAKETLSIVRQHASPGMIPHTETILQELREIDLFEWEGRFKSELERKDAEAYRAWVVGDAHSLTISGRKPILETWSRAETIWGTLRSSASQNDVLSTLMVCHGTLGQALLCTAFGWDGKHFRRYDFPNCGMVEVTWRADEDMATSWKWHHPESSERFHPPVDPVLA